MNILVNASALRKGGGIQVADSFCRGLCLFPQHRFVFVYHQALESCASYVSGYSNVKCVRYDMPNAKLSIFSSRNRFLDNLVDDQNIDVVLTVFGPPRWRPKVSHVCGFARAQAILDDSPFWTVIGWKMKLRYFLEDHILMWMFRNNCKALWTESSFISNKLSSIFPSKRVYTVSNNYNQIFDQKDRWDRSIVLPEFNGVTLLTISANYPHKNLKIILPTVQYLNSHYPDFNFRFAITIGENELPALTEAEKKHILFLGAVYIYQCPYLYEQCDIMFLPTLMECFSASYAEAMKMDKPILTTDLEFARSICGDAAFFYDALSYEDLAESIYRLAKDKKLQDVLVEKGKRQLQEFDTFEVRSRKLISIVEQEYKLQNNECA